MWQKPWRCERVGSATEMPPPHLKSYLFNGTVKDSCQIFYFYRNYASYFYALIMSAVCVSEGSRDKKVRQEKVWEKSIWDEPSSMTFLNCLIYHLPPFCFNVCCLSYICVLNCAGGFIHLYTKNWKNQCEISRDFASYYNRKSKYSSDLRLHYN